MKERKQIDAAGLRKQARDGHAELPFDNVPTSWSARPSKDRISSWESRDGSDEKEVPPPGGVEVWELSAKGRDNLTMELIAMHNEVLGIVHGDGLNSVMVTQTPGTDTRLACVEFGPASAFSTRTIEVEPQAGGGGETRAGANIRSKHPDHEQAMPHEPHARLHGISSQLNASSDPLDETDPCQLTDDTLPSETDPVWAACRIQAAIYGDTEFCGRFGTSWSGEMIARYHFARSIFDDSGVRYKPQSTRYVCYMNTDPFGSSTDCQTALDDFESARPSPKRIALFQLLSDRSLNCGGKGQCDGEHTIIHADFDRVTDALLMAHEFGHNFQGTHQTGSSCQVAGSYPTHADTGDLPSCNGTTLLLRYPDAVVRATSARDTSCRSVIVDRDGRRRPSVPFYERPLER